MGNYLVDIHGQGEHLSLLKPKSHLPLLDAYADVEAEREIFSEEVRKLRAIQKELKDLQQSEQAIAQRIDFLKFQIEEIEAAKLKVGEEENLRAERTRLANMEQLMRHTSTPVSSSSRSTAICTTR